MIAAFFMALAAFQNPPQETTPEVVVTASPLNPVSEFDVPYHVGVLTGDEIQLRRQARSFPEALKELPGVNVQRSGPAQGSPFIRGFTGYRNLLLVDGIRLSNVGQRTGPSQYWALLDPYLIDRVELIRGPASVLYGSDAMGGTVAAYTRNPDFEPGFHGHGRSIVRLATADSSFVGRQEFWGGADDFGARVGATYGSFGDIRAGGDTGEQPGTGYTGWSGDLKTVWRIDADRKLMAAYQRSDIYDGPRTHRTVDGISWHGTAVGTDLRLDIDNRRELFYVQYHWDRAGRFFDQLQASASWQQWMEREHRDRTLGRYEHSFFTADTLGLWTRLRSDTAVGTLTYGLEWYRDFVASKREDRSAAGVVTRYARGTLADDTTYDLVGAFVQDEFDVGDFTFTLGGRFNIAAIDADQVDFDPSDALVLEPIHKAWTAWVGSARAVYRVDPHWNLIAGVSQGFRAPSVHNLTAVSVSLSGTLEIPSPELEPERTLTSELGVRARYDTWGVELFGFLTRIDDVVTRELVANPFFPAFGSPMANQRINSGHGTFYGLEAAGHWEFVPEVTAYADVSWVFGETRQRRDDGSLGMEPADKVNPIMGRAGVRWEPKGSGWWVEALVTIADGQDRLSVTDTTDTQRIPPGGTPGFTIYTLRGGYRFSEHAELTASVENISDKDYRAHGSGSNEAGTNLVAGLVVEF
jgi:hemoglobin/transferrin/lactoferrin receptor protein